MEPGNQVFMNLDDYIYICPRCGFNRIEERYPQWEKCFCKNCGYSGIYLDFIFWPPKYSGENHYLICN